MMSKRILVIDDDACVRFVIYRSLVGLGDGFDVRTAGSAREALALLAEWDFDLVLTDLRMPDIDGIQLTEAIRSLYVRMAVVWMTAYGSDEVRSAAVRLGVDCCLEKPLEIDHIRASVAAALEQGGQGGPAS